jgi:hypothetical protein
LKHVQISQFVGGCLRKIKTNDWIIISYSDTEMSHHGFVYQATNFMYTGQTKRRTDKYTEGNKHPRHYDKKDNVTYRKVRSSKHRYVFFCTKDKKLKKTWQESLKYDILPYPKGENKNYVLGKFLKPNIIKA